MMKKQHHNIVPIVVGLITFLSNYDRLLLEIVFNYYRYMYNPIFRQ